MTIATVATIALKAATSTKADKHRLACCLPFEQFEQYGQNHPVQEASIYANNCKFMKMAVQQQMRKILAVLARACTICD